MCALNPHAGEQGAFGDEERILVRRTTSRARTELPVVLQRDEVIALGPIMRAVLDARAAGGPRVRAAQGELIGLGLFDCVLEIDAVGAKRHQLQRPAFVH